MADIHDRLAAIEAQLKDLQEQISGIQRVVADADDFLYSANRSRASEIAYLRSRIDKLQECVEPTFHTVFPRQSEFIEEVDRVIASRCKPGD